MSDTHQLTSTAKLVDDAKELAVRLAPPETSVYCVFGILAIFAKQLT